MKNIPIGQHMLRIADENPDNRTVIEIGTNVGSDTRRIYNIFKPCTYYAFEPDPNNYTRFEENPVSENVILTKCAVGDKDGTTQFNQTDCIHPQSKARFTGASSILNPSELLNKKSGHWMKWTDKITVPICRLDTFMTERGNTDPITFIWCDAQGAEGYIIKGATETLKRTKYFYFEVLPDVFYEGCFLLDEMLKMLPSWEIVEQYSGDILLKNREF